jgi:hypothetical protein
MNVPFLDVGAGYRELQGELDQAYRRVMEPKSSSWKKTGLRIAGCGTAWPLETGWRLCI